MRPVRGLKFTRLVDFLSLGLGMRTLLPSILGELPVILSKDVGIIVPQKGVKMKAATLLRFG